ncbi:carbamoyltransferase HypF [Endothiovibrio diazotrophicus]
MPTRLITLTGRVQGVGFRPFVYRLAHAHRLTGWVRNRAGRVEILAAGDENALERFERELIERAPPLARPEPFTSEASDRATGEHFAIHHSDDGGEADVHVPPDQFCCDDCLAELRDPGERRHRYPFINCTQCGPRYTLIRALPYDRSNTTLANFPLCAACRAEYGDPLDRRFHAQPLACPECGPRLAFRRGADRPLFAEEGLQATLAALRRGEVVAVKGVGGYHLLCDARDEAAVTRLRRRKPRPHKPLAVLFPPGPGDDPAAELRAVLSPDAAEEALVASPMRPIVLIARRPGGALAEAIAPGLDEVGAMLPYAPLHALLAEGFGGPLVATSGNPSGEPVLTDEHEAERRLAHVADAFLHHDRPIERPADDPLYRTIAGRPRPLRLGRGNAPLELRLPRPLERPVLALGGQMKGCVALGWYDRAVLSPHIGELDTPRGLALLRQVGADLQRLYGVRAEALALDAHPGYSYRRWATESGLPLIEVFHHQAHAAALAGEFPAEERWLTFTWDGVGYGEDGTLWGGEALLGRPGAWRRVASLRPFRLPGGDKAGREPWRSAAALCWEIGAEPPFLPAGSALLKEAWARGLNAPLSSAAGRLFDAAASLLGILHAGSFEGQGPMWLEARASGVEAPLELPLESADDGLLRGDWSPLIAALIDGGASIEQRATLFHATLARLLRRQAEAIREREGAFTVGLTGGVFQNRRLAEAAAAELSAAGFPVHLPSEVPANDAGLGWGQLVEAATRPA